MTDKHKQRAEEIVSEIENDFPSKPWFTRDTRRRLVGLIALALSEAVAQERERCAKVADDHPWLIACDEERCGAVIAAKIREGV